MSADKSFPVCIKTYIDDQVNKFLPTSYMRGDTLAFDIKLVNMMYSIPSRNNKIILSYDESVQWSKYIEVCVKEEFCRRFNIEPKKINVSYYNKREYTHFRGVFMIEIKL